MASAGAELYLDLDNQIEAAIKGFKHSDKRIRSAIAISRRRFVRWLERRIAVELSRDTGITQKAIRSDRIFSRADYSALWVGLNPVDAIKAGNVRVSKLSGARAAGNHFPHAFRSRIYGRDALWERKYRGLGSAARGLGDGRFPVQKVTIPIEGLAEEAIHRIEAEATQRFKTILEQNINFKVLVEK